MPGPAAWVLVTFLRRQGLREWLPGAMANLWPDEREQLQVALLDMEECAEEYKAHRASGVGSAELVAPEAAASSSRDVTAREAAAMLRVSDRRVRQLCASGDLDGRRDGLVWLIDRASVELYRSGGAA